MNGRVLLLAAGVALVLLTSGLVNGLLGPSLSLLSPESPLYDAARWSGGVLTLVGLGLVLWPMVRAQLIPQSAGQVPPPPPRGNREGRKPVAAEALEAEKRGSYLAAAELFDRAGDLAGAGRCYAAALAENVGGSREFGRLLLLAVNRLWAAGDHDRAVTLAVEKGDLRLAADLKGRGGDVVGQAELLARSPSGVTSAVEVLLRANNRQGAAKLLLRSGDLKGAVELLADEDVAAAARFCEAEGHPLIAADLYERSGDLESAAALFAKQGKLLRAGQLYEKLGDLPSAAALLEQGGAWAAAAAVQMELGEVTQAGRLFLKAGDPGAVGRRLEARGDLLGAARGYLQGGCFEDALKAVSALPQAVQQDAKTRLLAAAILLRMGKPDRVIQVLRPIVSDSTASASDRKDSYYALGIAYQSIGDFAQATAALEVVSTLDAKYRDVALRLAELRSLSRRIQPVTTPPPPPSLPERYRIESKIGEGAMGVVYRANDSVLGRAVAVKVLSRELAENEKARTYFLREARAAAGLSHPNIVTLFDAGVEGAQPFLVMELLAGLDLETETLGKPLPERRALGFALQIADALAYVHARNIVHRDVKPANVMRLEGGEAIKLMDFGIAHLSESGKKSTIVAGTPDFMAPEQLLGRGLGPWTDVYALGGTLYQFLTGQVAYPEGSEDVDVPNPRDRAPGISAGTAQLVMDCLAKDAKARPQTAGEVRDRIAALLAHAQG